MTTTTASAVYEIEIAAPPDAVWRALTEPDLTAKYFYGGSFEADLRPGAKYRFVNHSEDERVDIDGEVVAVDPGQRLVLTQRFLWEPAVAAEPPTRVTWELEPVKGGGTRVRVVQDLRDQAPESAKANDGGMPHILSGLKATAEAL